MTSEEDDKAAPSPRQRKIIHVDGKTVLVVGGAGAVASCAIQIAKAYGARDYNR